MRAELRAETTQAKLIKKAYREFYAPVIETVRRGETPNIDRGALAERLITIIRAEARKPADEAAEIQAEMEASIFAGLGLRSAPETRKNARKTYTDEDWKKYRAAFMAGEMSAAQWRLFEMEYFDQRPELIGRQSFAPERRRGAGFSAAAALRGAAAYRKDPMTGRVIWDAAPIEYIFTKRRDLSTSVWLDVEQGEQAVFDIIRGGRTLGRDVKDIAKDLEIFVDHSKDGGARVMGRWMRMKPATYRAGPQGGLRRIPPDADLRTRPWSDLRREGKLDKLTPAAKAYRARFGKAGIDYRTMRVMRTETAQMLAARQEGIARDSAISTGEVDWILDKSRDNWNCKCKEYAEGGPYGIDSLPARIPVHPNCACQLRPRLKTMSEACASFREKYKDDIELIRGRE
jgi:hypothetical protein